MGLIMKKRFFIMCIFSAFLIHGCDLKGLGEEEDDPDFTGIARTDNSGNLVCDDSDDWQPRLNDSDPISFNLAYPNPSKNNVTVRFNVTETMNVEIYVLKKKNDVIRDVVDKSFTYGQHQVSFGVSGWENGVYRVKIVATKSNGDKIKSYGDIKKN